MTMRRLVGPFFLRAAERAGVGQPVSGSDRVSCVTGGLRLVSWWTTARPSLTSAVSVPPPGVATTRRSVPFVVSISEPSGIAVSAVTGVNVPDPFRRTRDVPRTGWTTSVLPSTGCGPAAGGGGAGGAGPLTGALTSEPAAQLLETKSVPPPFSG